MLTLTAEQVRTLAPDASAARSGEVLGNGRRWTSPGRSDAAADRGAPSFDHELAAKLAALGAPAFACTPDHFPGLMAAAIEKRDVGRWAAEQGIALEPPKDA